MEQRILERFDTSCLMEGCCGCAGLGTPYRRNKLTHRDTRNHLEQDDGTRIGRISRRGNELMYRILEGEIEGNVGTRGRPRTPFVEQTISDASLSRHAEPKRLAGDREDRRARVRLRNQPQDNGDEGVSDKFPHDTNCFYRGIL